LIGNFGLVNSDMDWINIPENIEEHFGFIYIITNTVTDKKYIGKKFFWRNVKLPPLKGQKRKRNVKKESDWRKYYGSSNDLKEDLIKYGKENFKREIVKTVSCKWEAAYEELYLQMQEGALFREDYYNSIINIRLNKPPHHLTEKYKKMYAVDKPSIGDTLNSER
jgi:regulation of enolase protein 1 (concanavalin A-like superfamily)